MSDFEKSRDALVGARMALFEADLAFNDRDFTAAVALLERAQALLSIVREQLPKPGSKS